MKNLRICDGCGAARRAFERWIYLYPEHVRMQSAYEPHTVLCGSCGAAYDRAIRQSLLRNGAAS